MRIFFLVLYFVSAASVFSVPAKKYFPDLPQQEWDKLYKQEELFVFSEDKKITYLPEFRRKQKILDKVELLNPDVIVEGIYLFPYQNQNDRKKNNVYLFNIMANISSLSGIQYYSERKKGPHVLFSDVHRINNITQKKILPDETFTEDPGRRDYFVKLKDANLGTCYYEADIISDEEGVSLSLLNAKSLGFIILAVKEKELNMQLVVLPVDEGFLVYTLCLVNPNPAIKSFMDMPSAFQKRLASLRNWFGSKLYD